MTVGDFVKGSPQMVPLVPSAAVSAGDCQVLGNTAGITCGVWHHDFANAATDGEIAIGGGIYKMQAVANVAAWAPVALSDAANCIVSPTTNAGPIFGYATEAVLANAVGNFLHDPRVL